MDTIDVTFPERAITMQIHFEDAEESLALLDSTGHIPTGTEATASLSEDNKHTYSESLKPIVQHLTVANIDNLCVTAAVLDLHQQAASRSGHTVEQVTTPRAGNQRKHVEVGTAATSAYRCWAYQEHWTTLTFAEKTAGDSVATISNRHVSSFDIERTRLSSFTHFSAHTPSLQLTHYTHSQTTRDDSS